MDLDHEQDFGEFDLRSETERINNRVNELRGRIGVDNGEIVPLARPLGRSNGLAIDSLEATYSGMGRHTLDRTHGLDGA